MDLINVVTENIIKRGACNSFNGGTLEKLVQQLFSPQGIEFIKNTHYPDLEAFSHMEREYSLQRFGIYVNSGKITLSDAQKVVLVGNTTATIKCEQTKAFECYLLHGANAHIFCEGYSVLKLENDKFSTYTVEHKGDNAIILK